MAVSVIYLSNKVLSARVQTWELRLMTPYPVATGAASFTAITLKSVKEQLGIREHDFDNDNKLNRWITLTIQTVENDTNYVAADTTFEWKPAVLTAKRIPMPQLNPTSITSISYVDTDDATQTESGANYSLDLSRVRPELVRVDQTSPWPLVSSKSATPWTITYQAGFATLAVVPGWFTDMCLSAITSLWHDDVKEEDFGRIYRALRGRQVATYL